MSRSLKKGPFVSFSLLNKLNFLNSQDSRNMILTWSRSSTILPIMIGHTIAIYNGRNHIPILISDQMIGHKLGEFIQTRTYHGHVKSDKKTKR
jgi:small subunit ribosomal protein S19